MERRAFLAAGTAGAVVANSDKPAVLGGRPVRSTPFPSWPVADRSEEKAILEVLRSGRWNRGSVVERFEGEYARLVGSAACLATANGTSALLCGLQALGVGPGKEVIVPPYTFIATVNVVLETGAIPVFVDTDRDTFQIDAGKVAAAITERTAAILPVHLGGSTADMDTLLAIGAKHKLPVLEDACQAHLAEWKGSHVGSLGTWGAFSFQASKNLNSGEGGALVSSDRELIERAFTFHNNGRDRKGGSGFTYTRQAEPAADGVSGRAAAVADDEAGRAVAAAVGQCCTVDEPARGDSGDSTCEAVRGHDAERVPPVHVPLRLREVCRSAPGTVPGSASG
jgi:perosamine synthetase